MLVSHRAAFAFVCRPPIRTRNRRCNRRLGREPKKSSTSSSTILCLFCDSLSHLFSHIYRHICSYILIFCSYIYIHTHTEKKKKRERERGTTLVCCVLYSSLLTRSLCFVCVAFAVGGVVVALASNPFELRGVRRYARVSDLQKFTHYRQDDGMEQNAPINAL